MTLEQSKIIHSILNQVGGILGPADLGIETSLDDFYDRWNVFTERVIKDSGSLSSEEKSFVSRAVIIINSKLVSGEAQTLTGYEDDERKSAIQALIDSLNVDPLLGQKGMVLPIEFRSS